MGEPLLSRLFKRIGLTSVYLMFSITIIMAIVYLFISFVKSIIELINDMIETGTQQIFHIIIFSIVIIFTLGIILYISGELIEFFFRKYKLILLDVKEYNLTTEDKNRISVIIPALNEEKTIQKAIEEVKPFCKNVIVVNDGSTDNTKQIAIEHGAVIVDHKLNLGLGQSLRDGIKKAQSFNSDIIVNFDADLQYRAKEIPSLVYYVIKDEYDLIMGSRFAGTIESMPKFKKFANKLYTRLLRYLTKVGISDGQTGFRAFTSEFAKKIR